jgi:NAD(P)-dependent dehydrogenase (short-subunit alcohol dehydrogenase family)
MAKSSVKKKPATVARKAPVRSSDAGKKKLVQFPSSSRPAKQQEPEPPLPAQQQKKPGIEARIKPRPRYEAPLYQGSEKLLGKVALITGGDSGIGRGVAVLYAREGANVAVVYLPQEQQDAEETRRAVAAEGRECLLLPGDVTDPRFCRGAVELTVRKFGKLDVLVNNAAYQQHQESIEDLDDKQWEHTFRVNIFAYFRMAKAALQHMKKGGAIINTGSETGIMGNKQLLDYAATKGAIHAFTKSLAQQLVERGIRVNCVAPGPIWTPLNVADKEAKDVAHHGESTPMGRPGQPEEVAPAYVFLAAESCSSYITGEVISILGGETIAG